MMPPMALTMEQRFDKFKTECNQESIELRTYSPWAGAAERPAAYCTGHEDIVKVVRATTGAVEWHQMGKGALVFPK